STTAPTYTWHFRYNASSTSAYKWEFVGGTARAVLDATQTTITPINQWVGGYTPTITVPRAGSYRIDAKADFLGPGTLYFGDDKTSARNGDSSTLGGSQITVTTGAGLTSSFMGVIALTAGETVRLAVYATAASMSFMRRQLSIIPVAVA